MSTLSTQPDTKTEKKAERIRNAVESKFPGSICQYIPEFPGAEIVVGPEGIDGLNIKAALAKVGIRTNCIMEGSSPDPKDRTKKSYRQGMVHDHYHLYYGIGQFSEAALNQLESLSPRAIRHSAKPYHR